MTAQLKSHTQGETLVLTLSNPDYRNALGPPIYSAGIEALNAAESNSDIRSVVITGEGAHFSAGGQLNRLLDNRQRPPEHQAQSIEGLHGWLETIATFPKPVLAAVEGAAAGAGFSLALSCDFLIAASNSVFVMAYSNVALSPDGGGSWQLARALPRALVSQWLMLGEKITAEQLFEHGLVNAISEPGQTVQTALLWADRLNARAPNALASVKELINAAPQNSLSEQMAMEKLHFVNNLHHTNAGIGIAAFLDKQTPRYKP
jgi:enoyl-CoA hydratase/carnithine racemase